MLVADGTGQCNAIRLLSKCFDFVQENQQYFLGIEKCLCLLALVYCITIAKIYPISLMVYKFSFKR